MKAIIIAIVAFLSIFFIGRGQCSRYRGEDKTTTAQVNIKPSLPTEKTSSREGWDPITVEDRGYNWYKPANPTVVTEWFPKNGAKVSYHYWNEMEVELHFSDGTTTSIRCKADGKMTKDGKNLSSQENSRLSSKADKVRFHPVEKIPLGLRVGEKY